MKIPQLPKLPILAPIASIMIFVLGSGVYTTLTTTNLKEQAVANWVVGCISSAFFSGMVISAFRCQHFIFRVGHIRAFAAFAAAACIAAILQGLYFSPTLWVIFRFIAGYCVAGLCVIIESWLMATGSKENTGTVLSIYMVSFYLAQALSQLFLHVKFSQSIFAYCLIAILASLSVLPVTVTKFGAPSPEDPEILSIKYLMRHTPLGVIGCLLAGMLLGPIYTLVPGYLILNGKTTGDISWVMLAIIMGGTFLQYPIGKISDIFDRRKVLAIVAFCCVLSYILFIPDFYSNLWLISLGVFIGAASFIVYPLAISYTLDHLPSSQMVSAIAALLLCFGVGSVLGPLTGSVLMDQLGPNGLCYYFLFISCCILFYTLYKIKTSPIEIEQEPVHFVSVPCTSAAAITEETQLVEEDVKEVQGVE